MAQLMRLEGSASSSPRPTFHW